AFGKTGDYYYYCVRGIDDRPVEEHGDPKSLSREVTLYEDCLDLRRIRVMVRILSRKVVRRTREHGFFAKTVTLKLKYADFRSVSRTIALPGGDESGEEVGEVAVNLLARTEAGSTPVRLIGVGLGGLSPDAAPEFEQLELALE
ncbi:MAG: DNA polymerase IV, partial [Lentisphaeria bacterium]|nr:DNA polymerase IV [Lentisphaeria bacterium]